MESPEQDKRQDEATAASGHEGAAPGQARPQQGEAPPPDEDVARNPDDPRLNDIKGS